MKKTGFISSFITSAQVITGLILFSSIAFYQACGLRKNVTAPGKDVISLYTKTPPVIDGIFTEAEWGMATSVLFKGQLAKREVKSENETEVHTLWDEQNLYMVFEVKDKDLQSKQTQLDHGQLSRDDIIEFLIDARNDKDSCWTTDDIIYHINLHNQKKDDRGTADCKSDSKWNGDAKSAVKLFGTLNNSSDIDKGYLFEIAISWDEMNVRPKAGFRMGIDFCNGDGGIFYDWAGASPFRSPYAFPDLILKK